MTDRHSDDATTRTIAERCERCGRRHVAGWVWLELNNLTGHFCEPGSVPAAESQGLFRFGRRCAGRARACQ